MGKLKKGVNMRVEPIKNIVLVNPAITSSNSTTFLDRYRKFINNRIRNVQVNDSLSQDEKDNIISQYREFLDKIDYSITKRPFEMTAKKGIDTNKPSYEDRTKPLSDRLNKASTAINYGFILSRSELNNMQNLISQRNKENSNTSLIDDMLGESQKNIEKSAKSTSKAVGAYAQITQAILEKEAEKIRKNDALADENTLAPYEEKDSLYTGTEEKPVDTDNVNKNQDIYIENIQDSYAIDTNAENQINLTPFSF